MGGHRDPPLQAKIVISFMYHTFCFFIPKNILSIPLKNFGLLTNTTFINCLLITSIFATRNTEYNNPYCKNGNKKSWRTKTTNKQSESKSKSCNTFASITWSAHFCSPLNRLTILLYKESSKRLHKLFLFRVPRF